ncbi:hypothetical protein ACFLYB_05355 [Chloroflexota bacterium]
MNIFHNWRAKKMYRNRRNRYRSHGKRQLNVVIGEGIVVMVKSLSEELGVSMAILVEHLLQVAIFHLMQIKRDEKSISLLKNHLNAFHLQRIGKGDSRKILRLGCERTYNEEFLPLVAKMNKTLNLLGSELGNVINKYCTAEEKERIKELQDVKDQGIIELVMWVKGLEARLGSTKEELLES